MFDENTMNSYQFLREHRFREDLCSSKKWVRFVLFLSANTLAVKSGNPELSFVK
jgi:hypothetical protein